jgi:hypothetical protein
LLIASTQLQPSVALLNPEDMANICALTACLSNSGETIEEAAEGAEGMDHRAA